VADEVVAVASAHHRSTDTSPYGLLANTLRSLRPSPDAQASSPPRHEERVDEVDRDAHEAPTVTPTTTARRTSSTWAGPPLRPHPVPTSDPRGIARRRFELVLAFDLSLTD
jgi:hypothetical protein